MKSAFSATQSFLITSSYKIGNRRETFFPSKKNADSRMVQKRGYKGTGRSSLVTTTLFFTMDSSHRAISSPLPIVADKSKRLPRRKINHYFFPTTPRSAFAQEMCLIRITRSHLKSFPEHGVVS